MSLMKKLENLELNCMHYTNDEIESTKKKVNHLKGELQSILNYNVQ